MSALNNAIEKLGTRRLVSWLIALLVFNIFAVLSVSIRSDFAYYLFPALGAGGALTALWMGQRFRIRVQAPISSETASSKGGNIRFIVILIILSALINGWQSLAAPPHRIIDTWQYFIGSDQLLGYAHTYVEPENPGFLQDGYYTYAYPLFIAIHRLLSGDLVLLIFVQHLLRVLVVIGTFLILQKLDIRLAKVTGVLLALSPITANNAHLMLTEGVYAPLILFFTFIIYLAVTKATLGILVLTGVLIALIAWIRPAGTYLVIPIMLLLFLVTHNWKKVIPAIGSMMIVLLLISGGRWSIDRNFTFQTTTEGVYYFVGMVFHNLYADTNGPISTAFYEALRESDCSTDIVSLYQMYPGATRTEDLSRQYFADEIWECAAQVNPQIANRQTTMLVEAIQTKPFQFSQSVFDEFMYFISQMEINILWQSTIPPICDRDYALAAFNYDNGTHDRFRNYACTFNVPENALIQTNFANYNVTFLFLSQPYLLLNLLYASPTVTFAGACCMAGFVWIEGSPRWRLLLLIVLTIIIYHAAMTALFFTQPRYVMVLNGLFVVVASMFYAIAFPQFARSLQAIFKKSHSPQQDRW